MNTQSWDPTKIKWEQRIGNKGAYETAYEPGNPDYQRMLHLLKFKGDGIRQGDYFYWIMPDGNTVGRKNMVNRPKVEPLSKEYDGEEEAWEEEVYGAEEDDNIFNL
jgi:hypothetical protein